MRFTSAIIAALAIASIGVSAAPTPDGHVSSSVDTHKPAPTSEHKPAPTPEHKEEHKPAPKPEHPKEPEYELVCKDVAFFHDWDIYWADVSVAT
jgi:outer membrane biosynthesis protein TonB